MCILLLCTIVGSFPRWTGWGFLACRLGPLWCLEAGSEWDWWGSRPPPPPSCPTMSPPRADSACKLSVCTGQTQLRPSVPNLFLFLSPFMLFNSFIACSVHLGSCFLPFSLGAECPGSSKAQKWCVVCAFLLYSFSLSERKKKYEGEKQMHSHKFRSGFISGGLMQLNSWTMQRDVSAGHTDRNAESYLQWKTCS